MKDSVFSVDTIINLVQKLRQENAECKEAISQTKHRARVLEKRMEKVWPGRRGWQSLVWR